MKFRIASALMATATAQPILMKILYEADCPFCKNFIANDVSPHSQQNDPGCLDQVDIDWIPYGNAAPGGDGVVCQHGEDECFGNRLHVCAKHKFEEKFPAEAKQRMTNWVTCVMSNLNIPGKQSHDRDTYEPCDGEIAEEITQCANDRRGYLHQMGDKTTAVHPAQVPWVTFDGQESYNAQTTFINDICNEKREKGLGLPAGCSTPCCRRLWRLWRLWSLRSPSARVRAD